MYENEDIYMSPDNGFLSMDDSVCLFQSARGEIPCNIDPYEND